MIIHDIEIYQNFFSDIFKVPNKNKLGIIILYPEEIPQSIYNEIEDRLSNFSIKWLSIEDIEKLSNKYIVGYNSYYFDDPLLNYLITYKKDYYRNREKFLYNIWKEAQNIVEGKSKYKYKKYFRNTLDLMRIGTLDRIKKPLKQVAANLRHYKIQDLPIKHDEEIPIDKIANIIEYELNDVIITEKLLLGIDNPENNPLIPKTASQGFYLAIEFRNQISKKWNLSLLNSNKSHIGEKLARKLYAETANVEEDEFINEQTVRDEIKYSDVILDEISFQTEQLKNFLSKLKSLIFYLNKVPEYIDGQKNPNYVKNYVKNYFTWEFELYGLLVTFAQGGLHGVPHKSQIIEESNDWKLRDYDFSSYYPFIYWKKQIYPKHLGYSFVKFVEQIILQRLEYKKEGNKLGDNGLKIPINRIFGGLSDKTGWMYDLLAFFKVTINGQLYMLMIIEDLFLNGIETFYANTDGFTCKIPKDKINETSNRVKNWAEKLNFKIDEEQYSKFILRDVNNYIAISKEGKVKSKGSYSYHDYIEKYGEFDVSGTINAPIIPYAVQKYFIDGISVEETIENHIINYPKTGIYDYTYAYKTGKQFTNQLFILNNNIEVYNLQQSIRYYIANTNKKLFKVKEKTDKEILSLTKKRADDMYIKTTKNLSYELIRKIDGYNIYRIVQTSIFPKIKKDHLSYTDTCVNRNIELFNDYFYSENYNIDFDFYINEAKKMIKVFKTYENNN